jgi:hypothetical protein
MLMAVFLKLYLTLNYKILTFNAFDIIQRALDALIKTFGT